jgi:UDP-GlcNAc3NAcA epimerase
VKVVSVVGARPQFIKAAAVSRCLRQNHREILVHTGQHYDYEMSGIFFDGLSIPAADVNLSVGSRSHGAQTGAMLEGIEKVLIDERPDWLLVYGDTNSTLAAALAASKLGVRVAHVEAGLRSFNRGMPEEINRVLSDHLADLLLCPSEVAVRHLAAEGLSENVHVVGDVMLDVLTWANAKADEPVARSIAGSLGLSDRGYLLVTIHRAENTDNPARWTALLTALNAIDEPIVFPAHPRARRLLETAPVSLRSHVRVIDPVGYVEMVRLTRNARVVVTDSGGLQKEAYWLGVPCVTLRGETEWTETISAGWNILAGSHPDHIAQTVRTFRPTAPRPALYGEVGAAARCVACLEQARRSSRRKSLLAALPA